MSLLRWTAEISSTARAGVYDCLYVTLAYREDCELVTADSRLLATLKTTFAFIINLASLPWLAPKE
jgi:predicted nucleic acid-binding protein